MAGQEKEQLFVAVAVRRTGTYRRISGEVKARFSLSVNTFFIFVNVLEQLLRCDAVLVGICAFWSCRRRCDSVGFLSMSSCVPHLHFVFV